MAYKTDLSKISLENYKQRLTAQDMIPSWKPLLENIDQQFSDLAKNNISNIEELREKIRTKKRLQDFSQSTSIDISYLVLIARELNSRVAKPLKLSDFPNQDITLIEKLEARNIKTTEQLYNLACQGTQIKETLVDISIKSLKELIGLSEITRLRWVSHTFAYVLYKAGFENVKDIAAANVSDLYKRIKSANAKFGLYKGNIGERDLQRCIDDAKQMPFELELKFD